MLQRRRAAAKKAGFKRKNNPEPPPQVLDEQTIERGRRILDEFASIKATLTPRELARRLGVSVNTLYLNAHLCELLSQHNKQCFASMEATMSARLEELQIREEPISQTKFLKLCGISEYVFYHSFPEWIDKLHRHNESMCHSQKRKRIEQHMRELQAERRGRPIRDFAKDVGLALHTFREEHADIAQALVQHNKSLGLNQATRERIKREKIALIYECWNKAHQEGKLASLTQCSELCHIPPRVIRRLCPELIAHLHQDHQNLLEDIQDQTEVVLASAFADIQQDNEETSLKQFAAAAGISERKLRRSYPHWRARLEERNKKITLDRLQATWEKMENNGAIWSPSRFAREAKMHVQALQSQYTDWFERVNSNYSQHSVLSTRQKLYTVIEECKREQILRTPNEIAKQVGIGGPTFFRCHKDLYQSLVEYNRTAFRSVVEATWEDVSESGSSPTLSEFAKLCGFRHFSVLLAYFPDIAEQVCSQACARRK